MKKLTILIGLILIAVPAIYSQNLKERTADKASIKNVVVRLENAWAAGDGQLWADNFTDDVDYTVWNGTYLKGREQNAASHQGIFDTFYKGTTMHSKVTKIRFLSDSVALVHIKGYLLKKDGSRAADGLDVTPMAVFKKTNGKWLITAFQNTPVIKPGELVIGRKAKPSRK